MRVLLLTQGHTPNVGDEAIYLSEKEILENNGFDVIGFPFWEGEQIVRYEKNSLFFRIIMKFSLLLNIYVKRWIYSFDLSGIDFAIIGGGTIIEPSWFHFLSKGLVR